MTRSAVLDDATTVAPEFADLDLDLEIGETAMDSVNGRLDTMQYCVTVICTTNTFSAQSRCYTC